MVESHTSQNWIRALQALPEEFIPKTQRLNKYHHCLLVNEEQGTTNKLGEYQQNSIPFSIPQVYWLIKSPLSLAEPNEVNVNQCITYPSVHMYTCVRKHIQHYYLWSQIHLDIILAPLTPKSTLSEGKQNHIDSHLRIYIRINYKYTVYIHIPIVITTYYIYRNLFYILFILLESLYISIHLHVVITYILLFL